MIPKMSLDSVLDKSIILTKTAPNDNAKSISVQCRGPRNNTGNPGFSDLPVVLIFIANFYEILGLV